jgi:hypothetical protein
LAVCRSAGWWTSWGRGFPETEVRTVLNQIWEVLGQIAYKVAAV